MAEAIIFVESNTTGTGRLFAERARDLGLVPHMLCVDAARYPYLAELDIPHHPCRTDSQSAVLAECRRLARGHEIAGVTSSSEYFVATAAGAARALGLPGEDPGTLAAARDKSVQRQRFAAHGVDSPDFRSVSSVQEAMVAAEHLGLPVVMKPVSRSGSIGVRRCDTVEEVGKHCVELLATTVDERGTPLPSTALVESYLSGPEFSVEILNGEVRAVVAKHLDQSQGFLEIGHDVPAAVDRATGALLADSARAALAALGLGWGAAHVELRIVDGRACVVEVNPRLAGGMIPQAIRAATGQDLIAELIAATAGRNPVRGHAREGCAAIRFLVPSADGEVGIVSDPAAVRAMPGVVAAAVTARPGRQITRQGNFQDRLGYAIATGDTQRQAGERAEQAIAAMELEIVPAGSPANDTEEARP
ncbi:ATP-grasp domain-containing protein [Streptomyces chartreusis]|uniref:ATP-grasp domain-containing protein n=1 Tax=Streptomyces chartreusis TaxID=1969 RepID=UPI0033E33BC0